MEEKSTNPQPKADVVQSAGEVSDYFASFNFEEAGVNLESMLKNGIHFGHRKSRRHPAMEEYIYTTRQGINIINLGKTAEKLEEALAFIKNVKTEGKKILFISNKKQAADLIKSIAKRLRMPYVVERWLGGTFTNFKVIRQRVRYLKNLREMFEKGELKKYTKFEQMKKMEEIEKLENKIGGIEEMTELPGAIFVVDIKEDYLAIREARKVGIPVIALADTNVDPREANYPIPANDDAISSLRFILGCVGKALSEENGKNDSVK